MMKKNISQSFYLYNPDILIENCTLDFKNNIKIPQNKELFFIIKKSEWNFAIDIELNISQEIDYLNLFLIVKSYIYTNICKSYGIRTLFLNLEDKKKVSQSENIFIIKNMDFIEFFEWINFKIKNDWEYNKKSNFYSLRIIFEKNTVILRNKEIHQDSLEILKPIYPWSEKWVKYFEKSIEKNKILEKKIELLEKIIKDFKKK